MKRIAACGVAVTLLLLQGCARDQVRREMLDRSASEYARMLRWKEYPAACAAFADASIKEECLSSAEGMKKDVSVAEIRVKATIFDEKLTRATISGEMDCFVMPSPRLRTLEFKEEWRHDEKGGWKLFSLPPQCK